MLRFAPHQNPKEKKRKKRKHYYQAAWLARQGGTE